jgi:hypothetical protein
VNGEQQQKANQIHLKAISIKEVMPKHSMKSWDDTEQQGERLLLTTMMHLKRLLSILVENKHRKRYFSLQASHRMVY